MVDCYNDRVVICVGWGLLLLLLLLLILLITVHFIIQHTSVASIADSGYLKKIRIKERSVPTYFKNVKEPPNNLCNIIFMVTFKRAATITKRGKKRGFI